jgi:hypothetical protein
MRIAHPRSPGDPLTAAAAVPAAAVALAALLGPPTATAAAKVTARGGINIAGSG